MRNPYLLAVVGLAIAVQALVAGQGAAPEKPNIVVILADDLGWRDLGCYGSEVFRTPNLDRMARDGMQFSSAYAASCVCSPTRASIMTGKYPARLGLTIWLGGKGGAPAADHLALAEITLAETLRASGYTTALVGKWHLGNEAYWPKQQGFDIAIGEPHSGSPAGGYYLPNRINLPGATQGDYLTDRLTDEAVKIIEENRDRPFFLYQAYHAVHTPIQGRPDLVKEHQSRAAREGKPFNAQYAAMIESLDRGVGRIMETLRKHELLQHTAVFFLSDNGGFAYSGGKKNNVTDNTPLRFGKGYCYEGGHRIPWLVCYPPLVKSGSRSDEPVITTDLYPTILRLAGLPAMPQQHVDGIDFSPLLGDSQARLDRDSLFWHYPHPSPQGGTPSGAIRCGEWKLIESFDNGRTELYRLSQDLGEQHDLAREMPVKARELHQKLVAWRQAIGAKLPPSAANAATLHPQALLQRSQRVLFLGDSITASGHYVAAFDAWLQTQRLEQTPEVINAGLPSETVSGLNEEGHAGGKFPRPDLAERLDRVLTLLKPDLVMACYGINCGIYQPFDETRFQRYQQGLERLKDAVVMHNARLILMTPPFYDDQRSPRGFSYDAILQRYSQWLLDQRSAGWLVIDLHGPMAREVQRRREQDEQFTFQPDGVHPNDAGHWFVAQQLIRYFGDEQAAAAASADAMLSDRRLPAELLPLVQKRVNLLRDAYVAAAGHKRPGVAAGLPLSEAQSKAKALSAEIQQMLAASREPK
jgi:arylsulfatase A-like enzyme/lysophospholipase L1-like esterase